MYGFFYADQYSIGTRNVNKTYVVDKVLVLVDVVWSIGHWPSDSVAHRDR